MIRRIAFSAVPLAAAAALTMGGAAHAAPTPAPTVDSVGTIGYQAVQNSQDNYDATYFTHVIGQFGLGNPQYGNENPSLQPNGAVTAELRGLHVGVWTAIPGFTGTVTAARVGLCGGTEYTHGGHGGTATTNAGTTAQELVIPVSDHSYDVVAMYGQYSLNQGDSCLSSELPSGPNAHVEVLLSNISDHDTTQLDVLFDGLHSHNGTGPGTATFDARDLSNPSSASANSPTALFGTAHSEFYEADAGLVGASGHPQSSLGSDVIPDSDGPNLALKLAHVQLNGNNTSGGEVHGTLESDTAWTAVPVAYQIDGDVAGAVSPFVSDHFSVFTAPGVLGGYGHGH